MIISCYGAGDANIGKEIITATDCIKIFFSIGIHLFLKRGTCRNRLHFSYITRSPIRSHILVMEKEITIYDLAEKLNISPATVSRGLQDHPAISKKTKKRIQELAEQIGYRSNQFARNLRSKQTLTLGVIVPRLDSFFVSTVIAGMEDATVNHGYKLIITQSSESAAKEASSAKTLYNSRVDGLLVSLAVDTETLEHFDTFFQKKIPLVFFDRVLAHDQCLEVLIDNRKAAYEATRHLIAQGCTKLVHITAPPKRNVYADRLAGFKQALAEAGLPFSEDQLLIGNLRQNDGHQAATAILSRAEKPDGIFVANDYCAAACVASLKKAGLRIPEDIAIVGFNNDPVCTVVAPNLSTINYPGYEMGHIAATNLIQKLNGNVDFDTTNSILLRAELVVRESSKRR